MNPITASDSLRDLNVETLKVRAGSRPHCRKRRLKQPGFATTCAVFLYVYYRSTPTSIFLPFRLHFIMCFERSAERLHQVAGRDKGLRSLDPRLCCCTQLLQPTASLTLQ